MDSANAASAGSQKQSSSLGQRVLSALILLPLVVVLVWWSSWAVAITVAAVACVALGELYDAFAHGGFRPRSAVGFCTAIGLVVAAALRPYVAFDLLELVLMLAVIGSLLAELPRHHREAVLPSWALTLAGALYIGWLFSHIILVRNLALPLRPAPLQALHIDAGAAWLYAIFAITWLNDTGAYFAGRSFGRHRMAPLLSPKKTWEGAVGGLAGSVIGSVVCQVLLGLPVSLPVAMLLGLIGGVMGPLGDLAESLVKRQVGVKDIGRISPGHGGLLDRADSLLFTAPVLYYLIRLFTHS
jgi:phosphatidate cytidylyltransferase